MSEAPETPPGWRRVCDSAALIERGDGVVFDLAERVGAGGRRFQERAFVIRFDGQVRGYLNRCAHVPVELDWLPGRFFDETGDALLCSVHGAAYDPSSGRCLGGPCAGRGHLEPIAVMEREGAVWVAADRAPNDPT
jgi:nitrite reductase/ring-hydroxylating ferredoxin subunit